MKTTFKPVLQLLLACLATFAGNASLGAQIRATYGFEADGFASILAGTPAPVARVSGSVSLSWDNLTTTLDVQPGAFDLSIGSSAFTAANTRVDFRRTDSSLFLITVGGTAAGGNEQVSSLNGQPDFFFTFGTLSNGDVFAPLSGGFVYSFGAGDTWGHTFVRIQRGASPGDSASNPVLPDEILGRELRFDAPTSGLWFDPPATSGFEYTIHGADPTLAFRSVGAPPPELGFGAVNVIVDGMRVAELAPGQRFDFGDAGLGGVRTFELTGIRPELDSSAPGYATAFPTFLEWTGAADLLTMNARDRSVVVPGPASLSLLLLAIAGLLGTSRHPGNK